VDAWSVTGGPIEEVRAGDIVWFAPGERHWHGASPTTADDAAAAGFRAEADKLTASQRSTLVPADVFDAAIKERTAFQQGRQSPATP
jgi:hypothetical protein